MIFSNLVQESVELIISFIKQHFIIFIRIYYLLIITYKYTTLFLLLGTLSKIINNPLQNI